jgi:hypothetical protein
VKRKGAVKEKKRPVADVLIEAFAQRFAGVISRNKNDFSSVRSYPLMHRVQILVQDQRARIRQIGLQGRILDVRRIGKNCLGMRQKFLPFQWSAVPLLFFASAASSTQVAQIEEVKET